MQPRTREAEFSATTPSLLLAFELGVASSTSRICGHSRPLHLNRSRKTAF